MYGDDAAGGVATVHWLADVAPTELDSVVAGLVSSTSFDHVQVFVAGANGRYRAESYSPHGSRIQFCGHGALAAARVVLHELEPQASLLEFHNADRAWQARWSAAGDTSALTLIYKCPEPQACAVPAFAGAALGVEPVAAAGVGGETDYLILELTAADALPGLQPDFAAIAKATRRALIVTAQAEDGCMFRYFAPQYGDNEDAATGSAAVQLAAYWADRLPLEALKLRQCSAQGAEMQVCCRDGVVELCARVGYR